MLLDPGAIYGSFVGESESRLRRALRTAEAMAPVALWIDEIEKGFSAGERGGDGGTSMRVLGSFLRWLQDRPGGVFLVATCNDIDELPTELLRKGRFDETFFVDLPDDAERRAVLALHMRRRGRDPTSFDLAHLAALTDGFSGAELEGLVVAALYRAFSVDGDITTDALAREASATTPLARSRSQDIERMRAWARGRAVLAGTRPP